MYFILDFNQALEFKEFLNQIEHILKDRNLLLQICFDVFDTNQDGKITQLDIFKFLNQFNNETDNFGEIFYKDVC